MPLEHELVESKVQELAMQTLEYALVMFFEQVARRDRPVLQEIIEQPLFSLGAHSWSFTLPALYSFLRQRHDAFAGISYNQFRRVIYSAPINATIERLDAKIVIDRNFGHVDKSVYAFTWQKHPGTGSKAD